MVLILWLFPVYSFGLNVPILGLFGGRARRGGVWIEVPNKPKSQSTTERVFLTSERQAVCQSDV